MKLGAICCEIMKPELEAILAKDASLQPAHLEYMNFGLHVYPQELRKTIEERVIALQGQVDAIWLGYGFCQALEGIEKLAETPVVLPQVEDCIALLLGPRNYARERQKCAGTWFMTPGWCEQGVGAVIRELGLDRSRHLKKTPLELCKRLFANYKRALVIETGAGEPTIYQAQADDFAQTFNIAKETVPGSMDLMRETLAKAGNLAQAVATGR